jgi:competence ComEA-like helix-hairpin-helix protein
MMLQFTRRERITLLLLSGGALLGALANVAHEHRQAVTVHVVRPADVATWDGALDASRRVSLNTATAQILARLPGIGPTLAQRIVDYRHAHGAFRSLADLEEVTGVGPVLRARVSPFLTL